MLRRPPCYSLLVCRNLVQYSELSANLDQVPGLAFLLWSEPGAADCSQYYSKQFQVLVRRLKIFVNRVGECRHGNRSGRWKRKHLAGKEGSAIAVHGSLVLDQVISPSATLRFCLPLELPAHYQLTSTAQLLAVHRSLN